jgi:hypothetical protein
MSERKAQPKAPKAPKVPKDVAILGGPTEDGQGAHVLRIRQGSVSAGEIRPVKEGETITNNEVVRLKPLDADQRVCEVEVLHAPQALPKPVPASSGPARVSTPNYRKNWHTIFAGKRKRGAKADDWSLN